ncbi:short-chain dehydrogenase [Lederbergia citrisecunda]|uniref:short-chain dehydrogenase n=1 Tax=Lederbergia citrisecunda TaxID=2833583 RepID=UPI003D2C7543
MPCVHEFGIIDHLDATYNYEEYNPQKFNCISVDDDIINSIYVHLSVMKTYFHSLNRPENGLAYCGITIIPPDSLQLFYVIVTTSKFFKESGELAELAFIISQAIEKKKWMIHYGI